MYLRKIEIINHNLIKIATVLVIFLTTEVNNYRILSIFPLPFKSHSIFQQSLMKSLAMRGHQVDVISYYEPSNPPKNYKTIINLSNITNFSSKLKFKSIQEPIKLNQDVRNLAEYHFGLNICNLMSHEKMQILIKNPPKNPPYNLVITQGTTTNCFFGFGYLLNVPVVSMSPTLEFPGYTKIIGNPLYTSFYPTALYTDSKIETFWDRIGNTLQALNNLYRLKSYSENQSEAMKKYLSANISSVREAEKWVALCIVNTHFSIHGVRPKIPGFVEAGGLHIEDDDSSLTPDLKQWMDESKNGVILFSFGSLVPIESLPKETIFSIFSSFSKLGPVRILIKATEGYEFPFELPKNAIKMTWVPQISVLKHNNTRLIITHGGIHSIMEAIYFEVPVIGIPLFYDQMQNVQIIVNKGLGLRLEHEKMTENSFYNALIRILSDSKFSEAVKYHSKLFRDRPLSAKDEAAYWIEYIIKNGANSTRSPAVDLYWCQTDQLDIYFFLLLCLILIVFLIKIYIA